MITKLCARCRKPLMEFEDTNYINYHLLDSYFLYCSKCHGEIEMFGRIEMLMEKITEMLIELYDKINKEVNKK